MNNAVAPWVIQLHRALLYLYPSPFRIEFGEERTTDQEMQFMLLASAMVELLIAATVLLAGWFWMFVVKRRSRA